MYSTALKSVNNKYNVFSEVRGKGLLIGAVLNDKFEGRARDFLVASANNGLMNLVAGMNVRLI